MKRFKGWTAMAVVMAILLAMALPVSGVSGASDDTRSHWAKTAIDRWQEHNVVKGYPGGEFRPDRTISRAEVAAILNNLFGYYAVSPDAFADVSDKAWYAKELSIAKAAGYYEGFPSNQSGAELQLSRQDAFTLLARVFQLQANEDAFIAYADEASIDSYARNAVKALDGIVSGYPGGALQPQKWITRAEVLSLIDKLAAAYFDKPGVSSGEAIAGHAIVRTGGISLNQLTVAGNLYLAAGIGDGDVELNGITVGGTLFVAGGGEQSIHIDDAQLARVKVNRREGTVRVVMGATTAIDELTIEKAARIVFREGASVKQLTIAGSAAGTELVVDGSIDQLVIEADNVIVNGTMVERGTVQVVDGRIQKAPLYVPYQGGNRGNQPTTATVNLVDSEATNQTRSLFAYLQGIRGKGVIFGHQHATDEGFTVSDPDGVESDVLSVTGDYPGLFGWDTLSLDGYEKPGSTTNTTEQNIAALAAKIKQSHELGAIVTLSTHPGNFVTGGAYNDTSRKIVPHILPGGAYNESLNRYLDKIADLALSLEDDEGELIPLIVRLWHEQNGGWFWWGAQTTSTEEYKALFRYSVEYLRDVRGVSNALYAWSPNGPFGGNEQAYLLTYPGDNYVDILGLDQYDNQDNPGSNTFLTNIVADLAMISQLADSRNKVAALTEFGYSPAGMSDTGNDLQWFTKLLAAIKSDPNAKRIAYMQTWANFGSGNMFVPYKDAPGLGDHQLAPDFKNYYDDPYTAFAGDLSGVYEADYEVDTAKSRLVHMLAPLHQATVTQAEAAVFVSVQNETPASVTLLVGDSNDEIPMTASGYGHYQTIWSPSEEMDGTAVNLTVRVDWNDNTSSFESSLVYVQLEEQLLKRFTFDENIDGFQYYGEWYNSKSVGTTLGGIAHAEEGGNGMLRISVSEMIPSDDWQEVKVALSSTLFQGSELADTRRIKFDAWIPQAAVGSDSRASMQGQAKLAPDWNTAYDGDVKLLSELTAHETVAQSTYYKYSGVIDLTNPEQSATADHIQLSLIGKYLDLEEGSFYLDNIALYSLKLPSESVVDQFETYVGETALLRGAYIRSGNGDDVTLSLDEDNKSDGSYGMKYEYTLGDNGYAGVSKQLGSRDWSAFNQLQMWLKPDGLEQKLVIQIKVSDMLFEYYPSTAATMASIVEMPFNDFVPVHGAEGPITKKMLKNVQQFSIYTNAVNDARLSGTMYFDDIYAAYNEMAGEVPGGGPSGILYDFESGTGGWVVEMNSASAGAPEQSDAEAAEGSHSLKVDFDLSGASFELARVKDEDLSGASKLSLKVKLSSGTASALMYMKTGQGWSWHQSSTETVSSDGFTTLHIDLTGVSDADQVRSIGVLFNQFSGSGTASVYLDKVELDAVESDELYDFESGIQGWELNEAQNNASADGFAQSGAEAASGSSSIKADFSLDAHHNTFELRVIERHDFSGYGKLTAKVKVVPDSGAEAGSGVQVKLFVQSAANWSGWADSGLITISGSSSFETIELDLAGVTEPDYIQAIGLQFVVPGDSSGSASVYVDEIVIQP